MLDAVSYCDEGDMLGCFEPSLCLSFLDSPLGPSPLSPTSEHEYPPPPPPVDTLFYGRFPAEIPPFPPQPAPSLDPYFLADIISPSDSEEVLNIGCTGYGHKRMPRLRRYVFILMEKKALPRLTHI